MVKSVRSQLLGYAVALVSTGLAAMLTLILPLTPTPYLLFLLAILTSAWIGGLGPGMLSTVLSALAVPFMVAPTAMLTSLTVENFLRVGIFGTVGVLAVQMVVAARRAVVLAQAERQQLQVTLQSIGDGVIVTDIDGRVTSLNGVAATLTGWTTAEAYGQPLETVFAIVHEFTGETAENPVTKVLRTGKVVGLANHTLLIARDGSKRPIDDSAAPIRTESGEVTGVVLVFRDVSERRRAEQALMESEERHRLIAELTSDYTSRSRVNSDGSIVPEFFTEGFTKITGYTMAELEASGGWGVLVHPEDVPVVQSSIGRILAHGSDSSEIRIRTKTGESRWVRYMGRAVRDLGGQRVDRIISAAQDITEYKLQEAERSERLRLVSFGRDVGLALIGAIDLPQMLQKCAEAVVQHLDAAFARVWTLNETDNMLELQASAGMYTHLDGPHARVPVGKYKIGWIAETRRPHLTNSVIGDPRVPSQEWAKENGLVAFAGYPLVVDDRLVGVMAMFSRNQLSEATLDAMASVANGVASGIQRKQALTSLHEERERLSVTLASIGDAVIATDAAGRVNFLNHVAEQLTGWTEPDAAGKPLEEIFHIVNEQTRNIVDNPVVKVLRDGQIVGLANHTVLIAKDGSELPIDDSAAPIRDADGTILGAVLVFRDVSARRAAERTLRDSESRLRAIVETALDCIVTIDAAGKITEFNPAAERTFGHSRKEVIGSPMAELLVPEHLRDRHHRGLAHYLATGEGPVLHRRIELPALRADGSEIPVELAITPIQAGGEVMFTAHLRDITERKRAERQRNTRLAVTEILARSATLAEAAPEIIHAVCENLGWLIGGIWAVDREAGTVRCIEVWHRPDRQFPNFIEATRTRVLEKGEGLPGRVWSTASAIWIKDVVADRNFPRAPLAAKDGLHGAVACPIMLGQEVLGVLEFFNDQVLEPDADLIEVLTTLGGQIGQFWERRRAEHQLRQETQIVETLHRIGSRVAAELDLHKLLQLVTDETTSLTEAQFGAFFYNMVREDGETYMLYALSGTQRENFAHFPMPRNTEIFEPTFRGSGVVRLDDVTQDPRYGKNEPYYGMPPGHLPVRSYLAVPVVSRSGEVLGGLFFGHAEVGMFTERDERIVVGVAAQAAVAIDNARLYQQIQESEQRFRQFAEHIDSVFWMTDPREPRVIYVSPAYEKIWGYPRERLYAEPRSFVEPIHADDREKVLESLAAQANGQTTAVEYRLVSPDGSVRWVWDRAFPLKDSKDQVYRVAGVAEDITEDKRNETILAGQKRTLEQIVAGAPLDDVLETLCELVEGQSGTKLMAMILLMDEDGVHLRPAAGRSVPEGWVQAITPLRVGPRAGSCGTAAYRHEPVIATDISVDPMWEDFRDVALSFGLRACWSIPIFSSQKSVLGTLAVYFETPRCPTAQDMRLLEIAANTAGIAIERKRSEIAIQEADRRKDEFLATLAHELRNPLAPIRNSLQIMRMAGSNGDTLGQAREMIDRQVQQMVRLVDDLLDVSRISRGKIELRLERCELVTLVQSAVETSQPLLQACGHQLTVSLPEQPVYLTADPTRMAQVLANLLNNAAKYTDHGGQIWLTAELQSDTLIIRVRDTGIGIPANMLSSIFEMFSQVHDPMGRSQGGLGIGLTLVKKLVELHHGTVEAHSEGTNQGSIFTVRLPVLKESRAAQPAESDQSGPITSAGRRILVADDNQDAADSLAMLLRLLGHNVEIARDGPSALHAAGSGQFDIVFLDIRMPTMDGYEVARQLRQNSNYQRTMLVALTGWGQEEDRRKSQEAGFDHHLTKPAELADLERLLTTESQTTAS